MNGAEQGAPWPTGALRDPVDAWICQQKLNFFLCTLKDIFWSN